MRILAHNPPKADQLSYQDCSTPLEFTCTEVVQEHMIASNIITIAFLLVQPSHLLLLGISCAQ